MSGWCEELFVEVGLLSGRVQRGWLSVGTCSTRLGKGRYAFGEVGYLPRLFQRSRVSDATCRRGRNIVWICPAMSASCRE